MFYSAEKLVEVFGLVLFFGGADASSATVSAAATSGASIPTRPSRSGTLAGVGGQRQEASH